MPKIYRNLKTVVLCFTLLQGAAQALPLKETLSSNPSNFYIAYYSPADVAAQLDYQATKGVHSTIIWDMSGDVNPALDAQNSLIHAMVQTAANAYSVAYWTDWSIYPSSRALPYPAYFIPGAIDDNGEKISNSDFDAKANLLNAVVYSFLEVAPDGTVYFNDPWSDLLVGDTWCNGGENKTCSYAFSSQGKPYAAHYGNFEAFSAYTTAPIDKFISIGGYGHDASFEQILGDSSKIQTFVETSAAVLSQYHLTGIDLDYENPNMTLIQSQQFGALVQALNDKFSGTPYKLMVTTLANPAYLQGVKDGNHGFAIGVLAQMANLSQLQSINLMTYDFYGAFNYNPDGSGKTGLLADTYLPNNAPQGSINFSAQEAIETMLSLGIPAAKLSGGIPTYGRALQGISATDGLANPSTGAYTGLYATILSNSWIPRGDLDDISCDQTIYPLAANACSGSFTYAYIINHVMDSSFVVVDWKNNSQSSFNGTTAYTSQYQPLSDNFNLEVSNLSSVAGGQVLSIGNGSVSIGALDWLNPLADKTYDNATNPTVMAIQNANNLVVTWNSAYTGKQYQCLAFNFTSNKHIMLNPETGACDIKAL